MRSIEPHVSSKSDYYIYSPSKTAMEMFFYPLQCGHFIYESGYHLTRESFNSFLLMYIQQGSLILEVEQSSFSVKTGQFVLIDCYQKHSYHTSTGWECLWCHFDGPLARTWYQAVTAHLGYVFSLLDPYPVLNKLSAIYETFRSKSPLREPMMSKQISDILTSFLLYTPRKVNAYQHANMAEELLTYINEHFAEEIFVEDLANMADLSLYHFIRIFKKETGFTPHEYIVNTRIAAAKYLLKTSPLSIKEICFQTGFSCESVFCSAFKRHQGMTPAQYRSLENSEKITYTS